MRRSIKILKIYSVVFAVLTVLAIVLRCLSLFNFYDSDIGYYRTEAILPDIFHLISVLVPILAFSLLFLMERPIIWRYQHPKPEYAAVRAGAVFGIAAIASYVIYDLIALSGEFRNVIGSIQSTKAGEIVCLLALLFGLLGIVYFALILAGKTSKGDKHVLFGYAVILFVLMVLANTYFDFYTTMNSPNKLLTQVTLMSVMLYFLYELRFSLGNEAPRSYAAVSLAALYFTSVSSVPGIIAFFAGVLTKTEYLLCDFVALGFAFYICSRLVSYIVSQKIKRN
ncbi:MAG: hypothetical protein IJZ89_03945 [Clostridia bacterium]|nr:hypothetical protein [Clostridia bacterium]